MGKKQFPSDFLSLGQSRHHPFRLITTRSTLLKVLTVITFKSLQIYGLFSRNSIIRSPLIGNLFRQNISSVSSSVQHIRKVIRKKLTVQELKEKSTLTHNSVTEATHQVLLNVQEREPRILSRRYLHQHYKKFIQWNLIKFSFEQVHNYSKGVYVTSLKEILRQSFVYESLRNEYSEYK